ncbi:MAG: hypothetical protein JSR59_21515 [Proteobacteria bacterium]|nr:hypothetical protein [Pseudomonadota bacterium]
MFNSNISVHPNQEPLTIKNLHNTDGRLYTISLRPNTALIDDTGLVRFFTVDWKNPDETHGYLLHPYQSTAEKIADAVISFVEAYGLNVLRVAAARQLIKVVPGAPGVVIKIGTFFVFNEIGKHEIQSFQSSHFKLEHLGYHNILTDKLVWDTTIRVK